MFTKKLTRADEPATNLPRKFGWRTVDAKFQQMSFDVHRHELLVQPMPLSATGIAFDFTFGGTAWDGPLSGLRVFASLELRENQDLLRYPIGDWPDDPELTRGFATATDDDGHGVALYLTIFCRPVALDWIFRVFSSAAGSTAKTRLMLYLDHPTIEHDSFWNERWLGERLRVTHWDIRSVHGTKDFQLLGPI